MEFKSRDTQTASLQALQGGVRRGRYTEAEKAMLYLAGYNTDGSRNWMGDFSQAMSSVDIGSFGLGDNIKEHAVQAFLRGDEGDAMRSQGYRDLQARDRELQAQQYQNSAQIMQEIWGMAGGMGGESGVAGAGGAAGAAGGATDMMGGMPQAGAQEISLGAGTSAFDTAKTTPAESATTKQLNGQGDGSLKTMSNETAQSVVTSASKSGSTTQKTTTGDDISSFSSQLPAVASSIGAAVGNAVQQNELQAEKDKYIQDYISKLNRSLALSDGEYII